MKLFCIALLLYPLMTVKYCLVVIVFTLYIVFNYILKKPAHACAPIKLNMYLWDITYKSVQIYYQEKQNVLSSNIYKVH